ncbi:MAG: Gfo/Idh/MocA family oxidoreductase [Puniceicoccales bacterium]|jgi:predicted dehydrogenase|nr:Gfo/Idh/MocA family oxidoreductase [Puniceicoccales bacterium]
MQINCGVVGVGYLGSHHARVYSELDKAHLVGVFDLNFERAQEIAHRFHCEAFENVEALAKRCHAISVVTPTTTHTEVALQLLSLGCHLLIEKPLCVTLSEAEKVAKMADTCGRYIQVGHIEHYNPVTSFLETHVNEPRYITADRLAPFSARGTDVGVVLDLMIHDLGIVLQLVNSPIESIEAVGVSVLSIGEDIANARVRFKNGCIANFNASRVSLKKVREIRVFQPNKYLSLDFMDQKGHLLYKEGLELKKEEVPLHKEEPLKVELSDFIDCILKTHQPKINGWVARSTLAVALQITDLIRQGTRE